MRRTTHSSPSVRASEQLPFRCSSPLLHCMCWLPPSLHFPLSDDLLLNGQQSGLLLSYPRLPSALFKVWSADACSLPSPSHSIPPSPSLHLSLSLCLSCCLSLVLIISISFSQTKGDKLHLLVSKNCTKKKRGRNNRSIL